MRYDASSGETLPAHGEHQMSASLQVLDETRIDVEEAQRRLGTDDNPIHFTTVYRLMSRGLKTPGGERVTLEHLRIGGRLITSVEAISRFVASINGINPDAPEAVESTPARTKRREAELAAVDRRLDAAGIC
jgi:hypothetical protein